MNVKIGVLTLVGTQSHGACLQALALKEKIMETGNEVEIINYISPGILRSRSNKIPWKTQGIKRKLGALVRYPIIYSRMKKFRDFEKKYLLIDQYVTDINDTKKYDAIVCGSDQIWNLDITGNDYSFFLDYVDRDIKKLSYAASLGLERFPSDCEDKCFSLLNEFNVLNVREQILCDYLKKKIEKKIQVVLDPTLLFEQTFWNNYIGRPIIKKPYILVHYPEMTSENWKRILDISNKENSQIVFITNKISHKKGMLELHAVSPIEYLNYIRYSSMVITGSFHTLSFSLIFNKEFWCTNSALPERNSRLENLLKIAGLSNRILNEYCDAHIDYSIVNDRISVEREKSIRSLEEMLR